MASLGFVVAVKVALAPSLRERVLFERRIENVTDAPSTVTSQYIALTTLLVQRGTVPSISLFYQMLKQAQR